MPFSSGQKTFALIFIAAFSLLMLWAYKKDSVITKAYYKNAWLILIVLVLIVLALVGLVRITR
jgi:hypothetical protein